MGGGGEGDIKPHQALSHVCSALAADPQALKDGTASPSLSSSPMPSSSPSSSPSPTPAASSPPSSATKVGASGRASRVRPQPRRAGVVHQPWWRALLAAAQASPHVCVHARRLAWRLAPRCWRWRRCWRERVRALPTAACRARPAAPSLCSACALRWYLPFYPASPTLPPAVHQSGAPQGMQATARLRHVRALSDRSAGGCAGARLVPAPPPPLHRRRQRGGGALRGRKGIESCSRGRESCSSMPGPFQQAACVHEHGTPPTPTHAVTARGRVQEHRSSWARWLRSRCPRQSTCLAAPPPSPSTWSAGTPTRCALPPAVRMAGCRRCRLAAGCAGGGGMHTPATHVRGVRRRRTRSVMQPASCAASNVWPSPGSCVAPTLVGRATHQLASTELPALPPASA